MFTFPASPLPRVSAEIRPPECKFTCSALIFTVPPEPLPNVLAKTEPPVCRSNRPVVIVRFPASFTVNLFTDENNSPLFDSWTDSEALIVKSPPAPEPHILPDDMNAFSCMRKRLVVISKSPESPSSVLLVNAKLLGPDVVAILLAGPLTITASDAFIVRLPPRPGPYVLEEITALSRTDSSRVVTTKSPASPPAVSVNKTLLLPSSS